MKWDFCQLDSLMCNVSNQALQKKPRTISRPSDLNMRITAWSTYTAEQRTLLVTSSVWPTPAPVTQLVISCLSPMTPNGRRAAPNHHSKQSIQTIGWPHKMIGRSLKMATPLTRLIKGVTSKTLSCCHTPAIYHTTAWLSSIYCDVREGSQN